MKSCACLGIFTVFPWFVHYQFVIIYMFFLIYKAKKKRRSFPFGMNHRVFNAGDGT